MRPRLLVFSESDSFRVFWDELAEGAELELQLADDLGDAARATLVILSVPGSESTAAERVRDARGAVVRPPVVVGARADHRLAVELIRAGADDYFVLPEEAERLRDYVRARAGAARASVARARLAEAERRELNFSKIVGESPAMKAALERTSRIIPRGAATILITGETGTGKGLLAQAIHYNGPRAEGPFVELNCSAIPSNLLESEMFGHERGAFTDARRAKPGLFEVADGGTLFLDEVASLPLELQGKLLKALEDKRIRRVGGTRTLTVDVRIIAAANVDLAAAVEEGNFREDLYYRLSVIPIHLPPLRERGEDILLLTEHFVDGLCEQYELPRPPISRSLRERLLAYPWPGNVRELRNALERALLLGTGDELRPADLFPEAAMAGAPPATSLPFPATLEAIEVAAVREMLRLTEGNKSEAARRLGISRSRLHRAARKLEELEEREDGESADIAGDEA